MMKRNCQHSPKKAMHSLGTRDSEEKHLSTSKETSHSIIFLKNKIHFFEIYNYF
eukprot:UN14861